MFKSSSRCSIRLYAGQNGRCINAIKIPKSECPHTWIGLPKHKWPKSSSSMEDPVVLFDWNLYGHGNYGKGNLRKFYLNTVEEKFFLGMFICPPSERTTLIIVCGRYQNGRQDRKHRTDLDKFSWKRLIWRTNIISWPRIFGMYSERVYNK